MYSELVNGDGEQRAEVSVPFLGRNGGWKRGSSTILEE
jgi:hypothetical protein